MPAFLKTSLPLQMHKMMHSAGLSISENGYKTLIDSHSKRPGPYATQVLMTRSDNHCNLKPACVKFTAAYESPCPIKPPGINNLTHTDYGTTYP